MSFSQCLVSRGVMTADSAIYEKYSIPCTFPGIGAISAAMLIFPLYLFILRPDNTQGKQKHYISGVKLHIGSLHNRTFACY